MPKVIDHERRRIEIADALFEALREGGFANVTLSGVAARAGLAIGSVRHFLGTREQMIAFAFEAMVARVHDRVVARVEALLSSMREEALDADGRLEAIADLVCELLPMDSVRNGEAIVWLEFETAARTDPRLSATSRRAAEQVTRLVELILTGASRRGLLKPSIDLTVETARLSALVDGLTLRLALHPEELSSDTAREIVLSHLRELRRSTADPAVD